jgi:hypothetical protein
VGENSRQPALPGSILLTAGPLTVPVAAMIPPDSLEEDGKGPEEPAGPRVEPALSLGKLAVKRAAPARAEPSWGRVLADTIKLWVQRRLAPRRRRLAVIFLVLTVVAAVALAVTGIFTGTLSRTGPPASAGSARAHAASAQTAAAKIQAEAAAWMASQVSTGAMVACDPVMCAALQAHGVIAGRLVLLRPGSADPGSANVMVTSRPADRQLTDEYAPAVIASFGAGRTRIEVRVIAPGGVAAYASALRADLAARMDAGSQLLRNPHIQFTAQDAAQLRAGEVDSRLLATIAALSSVYSFRVTAFGDASPGAQVLFRNVTITSHGQGSGRSELAAARALVSAQEPPYLPAHATIIEVAVGQPALSIEFAAPSPLGLLSPVLTAYSSA